MKKDYILSEIKRTAADNGGVPLGVDRFREETGIRKEDWYGKFWAKWSDAQVEAGFEPNQIGTPAFDEAAMLDKIADYIREIGHFPTPGELRLRKRHDTTFPNTSTLRRRLGNKAQMVKKVLEHCCSGEGWQEVIRICSEHSPPLVANDQQENGTDNNATTKGEVYLLKHGKSYKIGRSVDATRRYKDIRVQMPKRTEEIHVIQTDDPVGIEAYWHNRFKDKRLEGEWFELSTADVKAFKKRRFM